MRNGQTRAIAWVYNRDVNAWLAEIDLAVSFPDVKTGAFGGAAGGLQGSGMYCGGFADREQTDVARSCFYVTRDDVNLTLVKTAFTLPAPRAHSCYASDGTQFVIAGGLGEDGGV